MAEQRADGRRQAATVSRLYGLLAAILLCLLGVLGFFYDSSFGTGSALASDDLAGILLVNGWRNVVYLTSGLLALAFAARTPFVTALALGVFYLTLGIWGLTETERGIGSLLDALPLSDRDNALHLVLGGLGVAAALLDGGLRRAAGAARSPSNRRPRKASAAAGGRATGGREARRRSPADPRRDADA